MKRQTARVLRGVLRLIENDLREIADSVVEIDEREAAHSQLTTNSLLRLSDRLSDVEAILAERADNHSRRVQS